MNSPVILESLTIVCLDYSNVAGLSLDVVLKADQLNKEAVFDSVPAGEYTVSVQCGPGLCESLKQWINFTESATVIAHKSFAYYQQRSYNLTIKNDKLTDEKKDLQADKALLAIEAECLKCKLGWGTVCDMIKEQCGEAERGPLLVLYTSCRAGLLIA